MYIPVLFSLLCYVSGSVAGLLGPCKKTDRECLAKSINKVIPLVYAGIPSLGIPTSDPMFQDVINIELPNFKLKISNVTIEGFKDCYVKYFVLNLKIMKVHYELDCPSFALSGNYKMAGKLLGYPVEGEGSYDVLTGRYWIAIDSDLIYVNKHDGKTYVNIANYNLTPDALELVKFYFRNLYNGRRDLSANFHRFGNENWKSITDFLGEPILRANLKVLMKNLNKFLETEPLEEIFLN